MNPVPLQWYIWLSLALFMTGMFGFLTRRSIILMFLSIEVMLNAVNLSLVAFSHFLNDLRGQVLVLFVVTVAASEAAIGLAILVALFRNRATAQIDKITEMKG
ncbi:MAG: NADH-quinone oxidoreductase subunit NuoK [Nitrospiraceae bacterium]|nr:NADH-quinone oxidoreductase subunit NuoK [Nitrospiraceae bacterium]